MMWVGAVLAAVALAGIAYWINLHFGGSKVFTPPVN
jgi:hypothetical protein